MVKPDNIPQALYPTPSAPHIPLGEDGDVVALLHELILRREDVMKQRVKKDVIDDIASELKRKGHKWSPSAIRRKKTDLLGYYNDRKALHNTTWRFYYLVAQLIGDFPFDGHFAPYIQSGECQTNVIANMQNFNSVCFQ